MKAIKLSEIQGQVFDVSYEPKEWCYDSVEEFINDVCDIEIEIAIVDFPESYERDEIYKNCKSIIDSQMINEKDLNSFLDSYCYEVVEITV